MLVVRLVVVGKQAAIAALDALCLGVVLEQCRVRSSDSGIEVPEMDQFERGSRDAREGLPLGREASQNAGATLSSLVGQDRAPVLAPAPAR